MQSGPKYPNACFSGLFWLLLGQTLDHHQREGSRKHWGAALTIRRRRTELGRHDEHAMIRRVEPHVTRGLRRLDGLRDVILVRRVLMNDGEGAVRIRGKRVSGRCIVSRAVDTGADRHCRDYLTGLIIGDSHHSAAASAE